MPPSPRRRRAAVPVLVLGLTLAGCTGTPASQPEGSGHSEPGPRANPSAPSASSDLRISLPRDQAAHPRVGEEWWYVVGHVSSGRQRFGYEVQLVGGNYPHALIGITDKVSGEYHTFSAPYSPDQLRASSD
ncbi:hypothetical protein ABZY90_23505 [Streptomyces sp. NPDC006422]|uniref:hypothetical protein n=1 Tax=unclassified Streptomyces TaxID=2593676 RepID=UPI0033A521DB